jgi:hypothetical protein
MSEEARNAVSCQFLGYHVKTAYHRLRLTQARHFRDFTIQDIDKVKHSATCFVYGLWSTLQRDARVLEPSSFFLLPSKVPSSPGAFAIKAATRFSSNGVIFRTLTCSFHNCFTSALAPNAANQLGREITMRIHSLVLVVASSATLIHGRRVEVPFGSSKFLSHRDPKLAEYNASSATGRAAATESSIVHVATNYDPNNIASAA